MSRIIIESDFGPPLEVEQSTYDAGFFPGYVFVGPAPGGPPILFDPYMDAAAAAAATYGTQLPSALRAAFGSTSPGYDLILLLGQSNMQGNNTGFDERTDPADGRVFSYEFGGTYAGKIVGALDPLSHPGGATGVGPGMAFGRWYAASRPLNRRVLLVPAAVTGTALGGTTSSVWNPEITGGLYDQAVTAARNALTAAGANSQIVAALWVQGEQDTALGVSTPTATYRTLLQELIGQLRADLGLPGLPFIIGGMVPEFIAQGATQQAIAGVHAAISSQVRYAAHVPGPSGYQKGDNLHYNPAGQRIQGRAMLTALATAQANAAPAVAPVPSSRGPASGGAPVAADNFGRADNANSLGATSTGNVPWAPIGTWGIIGGQAYQPGNVAGALATVPVGSSDHYAEAVVTAGTDSPGVVVRGNGFPNWYALMVSGGALSLTKKVADVITTIVPSAGSFAFGDTLRLAVKGSTLTWYRNGTQVGTATDSALTVGDPGIRCDANTGRLDNFAAGLT